MNIFLNPKFQITLGITTLLLINLGSYHAYQNHRTSQNTRVETPKNLQQNIQNIFPQVPTNLTKNSINKPVITALATTSQTENKQDKSNQTSTLYSVINEWQEYKYSVNSNQIFNPAKLPNNAIKFNQQDLLTVLKNTRKYFAEHSQEDPNIQRTGILITQGVTVKDILKTLDFMIIVLQEDIANNRVSRLQDPQFINNNFRVIKWSAHNPENPQQEKLRITKYAAFIHPGSRTKTAKFNTPIYALKDELKEEKFYTKYTKQDVLSGIYEPGGKEFGKVKPIAYLTRNGLEAALMQGTVLVKFTDGTQEFLNVDKNNGMSYIKGLKPTAQKRYWYFKEVDSIKGYGHKIDAKISIKPGVTFAGDVLNIGLGRIIVIEDNKQLKMGVIADTGGAFLPNLYQLDFLAGTFASEREFNRYIQKLPEYTNAYILVKK